MRYLWIVGLVLLAGSIAGTGYLLYPNGGRTQSPADAPAPSHASYVECFGHVDADGGIIALVPSQPGRVVAIPAREGQQLRQGDVIVKLDDRLARLRVQEAASAVEATQTQIELAKGLSQQHALKMEQQKAAIEVARQTVLAAELDVKQVEGLYRAQGASKEKLEIARARLEQARAGLAAEQARLRELQSHHQDAALALTRAESELQVMQARLDQAQLALRECDLRAPTDGVVLRVQVNVGDTIGGQSLQPPVLFWPRGTLIIRAEVLQEFAAQVRQGLPVRVRDDVEAVPAEWRGSIAYVSDWFARRRSILLEPGQLNDVRTLECIIRLDESELAGKPPLRIGQRVRVRIDTGAAGGT